MTKPYFHFAEVSQSVINDLIYIGDEGKVPKKAHYKVLDENLMPTRKSSECMMGHTGMEHVNPYISERSIQLFNEILEPIIGYRPNTHGRYGYYRQPIHIHNDGQSYVDNKNAWHKHNITGEAPKPANTTVFFPLRVWGQDGKPNSGTTSTIYFHQRTPNCKDSGSVTATTSEDAVWRRHGSSGWNIDIDYTELDGYTNEPFDKEIHEKYLKQHPIDMLHGFSFLESVPWNVGEVVLFETSRIHCSSFMENCKRKDCFLVKVNTDLWD